MAGSEINLYGVGDVDLTALMNTVDLQRVNRLALSLTNYDNTALPAIAAGSLAEVAGTWFKFTAEEAITGWAGVAVGLAYIKLVPAGTDPDTVTAEFTDTAPVWSDAKQWWYGTAAAANHRYITTLNKVDAATYANKNIYNGRYGERPMRSRVRVTKNNAQTLPLETITIVEYDDEDYDNLNEYDNVTNYRFTAKETGYYLVKASLSSESLAWNQYEYFILYIYKDGALHTTGVRDIDWIGKTDFREAVISDVIYLAVGSYIDIRVWQDRGVATLDTGVDANRNFFTVHRLS